MEAKIYETTLNLLSANKTVDITSFVPFKLNVDPSISYPVPPAVFFNSKINKIVYDWGDGQIDEQKFFPSVFSASDNTGTFPESGDPRNFVKSHVYSLSAEFKKQLTANMYLYQFGIKDPIKYSFNISLNAPRLDGTRASFFKNMHLVYTKMFDADNKILYIFEGKEPTWAFPVVIDWREKSGDTLPILGYDYKVLPLSN